MILLGVVPYRTSELVSKWYGHGNRGPPKAAKPATVAPRQSQLPRSFTSRRPYNIPPSDTPIRSQVHHYPSSAGSCCKPRLSAPPPLPRVALTHTSRCPVPRSPPPCSQNPKHHSGVPERCIMVPCMARRLRPPPCPGPRPRRTWHPWRTRRQSPPAEGDGQPIGTHLKTTTGSSSSSSSSRIPQALPHAAPHSPHQAHIIHTHVTTPCHPRHIPCCNVHLHRNNWRPGAHRGDTTPPAVRHPPAVRRRWAWRPPGRRPSARTPPAPARCKRSARSAASACPG